MTRNPYTLGAPLVALGIVIFGLTGFARQAPAPGGTGQAAPATGQPAAPDAPTDPPAPFYPHIVATNIRGGYQVLAADMNKDGRVDLVGLGSNSPDLTWYENPYWTPHVMIRGVPRMINVDAMDVDNDGIPEIGIAYGFTLNPTQGTSRLGILKADGDPRGLWTLKEIDAVPTSHRARFMRVAGRPVLVHAPIIGWKAPGTADPDHTATPLNAYRPPEWKRETITEESLGVVHDLLIRDWDGDRQDDVLTAGYQGVFVHTLAKGGTWTRTQIVPGDPAEWPRSGSSELAAGTFAKKRFFATNEAFHGNQVVVYQETQPGAWARNVIDTRLNNSHALVLVDADGDGSAEIVAGGTRGAGRGVKPGVFFYRASDATGATWERRLLDPTIAANGCVTADFNGDRKMDLACIDNSDPWSLRWYENTRK
jgi:hypothetical protein